MDVKTYSGNRLAFAAASNVTVKKAFLQKAMKCTE
jgi:hypothetical protein